MASYQFEIELVVILLMLSLSSVPFDCVCVGGNLLQGSPKNTNKRSGNGSVSPSLGRSGSPNMPASLLPRPRPRSGDSMDVSKVPDLRFYRDFIGEFSGFKAWPETRTQLLFPTAVDTRICAYLRTTLLEGYGLQTVCVSSQTPANTNNNSPNAESLDAPIISLHFLSPGQNSGVHSKFLIHYRASRPVLVLTGNSTNTEVFVQQVQPEINANYKWTLASRVFLAGTEPRIQINEVYGFSTSSQPLSYHIGYWSESTGFEVEMSKRRLGNFMGRMIRITSLEAQPVVYLKEDRATGELKGRGYLPDVLTAISSHLNFTCVLLAPSDKSFGAADESGNWSGMVGMLQRKEADMALMSFSLTIARKKILDFSPSVEYSSTRLLIRRDFQVSELKWNVFLEPFHWSVWFAIPITILVGSCCLGVFRRYQQLDTSPGDSAWLLSCCFLLQGLDDHSLFRKVSSRIVLGCFWILAVVVYASYTARLTSFLAATTETLPFKSLAEAVHNRNWKIGLVKGSAILDRIKESRVPEMQIFSSSVAKDPSRLVSGFREGVDKVFSEKFIFFTSDLVPSFMTKDNCSFTWIPGRYFPGFGYMGYQKNLPFADAISHGVSKLRESGQMRRLVRKWWGNGDEGCSAGEDFHGMSLYETGTAFLVLAVAVSVAVLIFAAELQFRPKKTPNFQDHNSETTASPFNPVRFPVDMAQSSVADQDDLLASAATLKPNMSIAYAHSQQAGESRSDFHQFSQTTNNTTAQPSKLRSFFKRIGSSRKRKPLPRFHAQVSTVLN